VVRRAAALLALTALGCSAGEPGGFGVNLHVVTGSLAPSVVSAIVDGHMFVTGDEQFDTVFAFQDTLRSGEARLRYIPGIHAGTIAIRIDARDGSANVLASGSTGSLTIVDGKATPATITLAGQVSPSDLGVDLAGVDLAGVDLAGVDLTGLDLSGVDLSGVDMSGGCVSNPMTNTEILNACTSAPDVDLVPFYPSQTPNGVLPALP
jgi:hypothetical protein